MITETVIYDHQIREVSRKTKEISFGHVIYEDNDGLHKINLDVCSENFNEEYGKSSGTCVGGRNIEKSWFILYTSGVKTKIIFLNRISTIRNIFFQRGACCNSIV